MLDIYMYRYLWKPKERASSLGVGVTGGCELPSAGTGT